MKLDQMTVAIRPMKASQAVDLGIMMAKHWFFPLWKIWLGMAFPVFIVTYSLGIGLTDYDADSLFSVSSLAILVFWWLKPLYEKPLVNWLGVALFSQPPSVKNTIITGWKTAKNNAVRLLFSNRLSLHRQLIIPILQLERPDSTGFKQRFNLLKRGQGGSITWFTLVMVHLEMIFSFGMVLFLVALVPQDYLNFDSLVTVVENLPVATEVLWGIIYFFSLSLIAPFYMCGGFALYLTKRCLLEGWDIELTFKQLAMRYQDTQQDPLVKLKQQGGVQ